MWRINGEELIQIHTYSRKERIDLFKDLRENRTSIECMCRLNVQGYPELHIRKTRKGYFPINNPSNRTSQLRHAADCKFNHSYVDYLGKNGVLIQDDGTISCSLESDTKGSRERLETILKAMFLNILATYRIDEYRAYENRCIDKRLYHAFCEYVHVNDLIGPGHFYIAHKDFSYFWRKHKLVIGWMKFDEVEDNGYFIDIPVYTLAERPGYKYIHRIPKHVYERSSSIRTEGKRFNEGFVVIFRDKDKKQKMREQAILFIPAHAPTKIPLVHPDEVLLLDHFLKKKIAFQKNLQPNLDKYAVSVELLKKHLAIDVIEDDLADDKAIEQKRNHFKAENKRYVTWSRNKDYPL